VVREVQVVGIVPEGITRLVGQPTRPITFISGPSATGDGHSIAFERIWTFAGDSGIVYQLWTDDGPSGVAQTALETFAARYAKWGCG
jgi:hypothetical protein